MTEDNEQTLEETFRLTKENNAMLHSMRRNAFLGGIVKFIFYIFILVVAPLWIYSNYLAPVMQEALKTMSEVQGTGAKAQGQINDFTRMLGELQSKLPSTFTPQQQ